MLVLEPLFLGLLVCRRLWLYRARESEQLVGRLLKRRTTHLNRAKNPKLAPNRRPQRGVPDQGAQDLPGPPTEEMVDLTLDIPDAQVVMRYGRLLLARRILLHRIGGGVWLTLTPDMKLNGMTCNAEA